MGVRRGLQHSLQLLSLNRQIRRPVTHCKCTSHKLPARHKRKHATTSLTGRPRKIARNSSQLPQKWALYCKSTPLYAYPIYVCLPAANSCSTSDYRLLQLFAPAEPYLLSDSDRLNGQPTACQSFVRQVQEVELGFSSLHQNGFFRDGQVQVILIRARVFTGRKH